MAEIVMIAAAVVVGIVGVVALFGYLAGSAGAGRWLSLREWWGRPGG